MSFQLFVHEAAVNDLASAALWYEEQRPGFGEIFIAEWERLKAHIKQAPYANVSYKKRFRQCRMIRFPYVIMYEIEAKKIIVYSIIHTSRNPKSRLPSKRK